SLPILFAVDEPPSQPRPDDRAGPLFSEALRRLASTFRDIRSYRDLFVFLLAFWFYNDGIGTIIRMAAIYGSSLGISMSQLVGALLATQFVAFPFSLAFGAMAGRVGSKRAILIGLSFYIVITFASLFVSRAWHFWVLAAAVGMVQGGVQAISRGFFASMIPKGREAEFFGFYDISSKFSGIVGPFVFGFVTQILGSSRIAIAILSYTFILGIVILRRVRKE
ncbi:MAG TPA: MFS transporter, partial [Synergistaceae bacterium]|nr:MFS transporter [Synergistaceae bacterium]